jgi:prophage antirepressor-like protein
LVEKGELMSDEEFRLQQPTREVLKEIKKTGVRTMAIERSREKSHLSPQELEEILQRQKKEEKPEDNRTRMKKLREDMEEHGYCPTCEEEEELERYKEEHQDED